GAYKKEAVMVRRMLVLAIIMGLVPACSSTDPNRRTKQGAAIGAVTGAAAGAVIGDRSGSPRTGAVVGGVAGAAVGAAIGRRMDQQEKELRQIQGIDVERPSEGEIAVRLRNDILFDFDSAELRPASRTTLSALAENFRRYADNVIDVEGHTDSTGSERYNQTLSERRAANVADYLIVQGVPASSITVWGWGEMRPRASNATAEERQLNRRVEIRIRARTT
ncbi:MAG TPA: OmpA family protein, partial [Thermoanaerobaculia bacterium]|nr:OmpA family protein [Thermoanaerobaculia bacterium]